MASDTYTPTEEEIQALRDEGPPWAYMSPADLIEELKRRNKEFADELTPDTPEADPPWETILRSDVVSMMSKWAKEQGYQSWVYETMIKFKWDSLLAYLNPLIQQDISEFEGGATTGGMGTHPTAGTNQGGINPFEPAGYSALFAQAMAYFDRDAPGALDFYLSQSTSSTGGGGTAARKATPEEIRAQFDIKELTRSATAIGQELLLDDIPNARALASAYVEAIVKSGGETNINFEAFIRGELEKTSRYTLLYRNKPDGVSEADYIRPYAAAALGTLGGNRGQGIQGVASYGAALGATPDAFASRLGMERSHQISSGFINSLEERMRTVSTVLRG